MNGARIAVQWTRSDVHRTARKGLPCQWLWCRQGHHEHCTEPRGHEREEPLLSHDETQKRLHAAHGLWESRSRWCSEKYGYEIMKQVKQDSQNQVKMGTGTLYGSLKHMLADGLIEEAGEKPDTTRDDDGRRYYRMTELGQRAFTTE